MQLSAEPSQEAIQTAAYLMDTFIEAAEGDMQRAGELAELYIQGMKQNNDLNVRETAQCLEQMAEAPEPLKYLT